MFNCSNRSLNKTLCRICLVSFLFIHFAHIQLYAGGPAENEDIAGRWVGGFAYPGPRGNPVFRFASAGFGLKENEWGGKIRVSETNNVEQITVEQEKVSFRFPAMGKTFQFEGVVKKDSISGQIKSEGWSGTLKLLRADFDSNDLASVKRYEGTYRIDDKRKILVKKNGVMLNFLEYPSLQQVTLFPTGKGEYVHGPGLLKPIPKQRTFEFLVGDDDLVRLRVTNIKGETITATKEQSSVIEEVSYLNGDISLAANLYKPTTESENPKLSAIIIVPGSGKATRFGYENSGHFLAEFLVSQGFAVLAYDKRGVGESEGDYDARDFNLLASDVAAGVRFLESRSDIDVARIGLHASSQGAMLAPIAKKHAPSIAFVIAKNPSLYNAEKSEILRTEAEMKADGYPESQISDAVGLQIIKFYYAKHRIGWGAYLKQFDKVKDAPWFDKIVGSHNTKEDAAWDFWKSINSYEPLTGWKDIEIPTLFVFGQRDFIAQGKLGATIVSELKKESQKVNFEVQLVPEANHPMFDTETGGPLEYHSLSHRSKGYFDAMKTWLRKYRETKGTTK